MSVDNGDVSPQGTQDDDDEDDDDSKQEIVRKLDAMDEARAAKAKIRLLEESSEDDDDGEEEPVVDHCQQPSQPWSTPPGYNELDGHEFIANMAQSKPKPKPNPMLHMAKQGYKPPEPAPLPPLTNQKLSYEFQPTTCSKTNLLLFQAKNRQMMQLWRRLKKPREFAIPKRRLKRGRPLTRNTRDSNARPKFNESKTKKRQRS